MELTPYNLARTLLLIRLTLSVFGVVIGVLLARTALGLFGFLVLLLSGRSLVTNFGALLRLAAQQRRGGGPSQGGRYGSPYGAPRGGDPLHLPRQLLILLYSIAEVDGRAGPRELSAIQQFLLQRFQDPRLVLLLAQTRVVALDESGLRELLGDLRGRLSGPECQTVFTWCALIALIDQHFDQREHQVLQLVAKELRIDADEARVLFHAAKEQALRSGSGGGGGGYRRSTGGTGGGWGQPPLREDPAARRREALATLGLDLDASLDDIRRRHRELAKKHHPDAHSHLGGVAQEEATERFRKIQAAYETLRESA